MKRWGCWLAVTVRLATATAFVSAGDTSVAVNERLMRLRTLGKAFYENPTTQVEAVEGFLKSGFISVDIFAASPADGARRARITGSACGCRV